MPKSNVPELEGEEVSRTNPPKSSLPKSKQCGKPLMAERLTIVDSRRSSVPARRTAVVGRPSSVSGPRSTVGNIKDYEDAGG